MLALGRPALILAPMEGVTDPPMRALLSERGGFSFCVSEFLRISQDVPPIRTYLEHVPELRNGSRTKSGLPVMVQLLGGDAAKMATAAARAVEAGAIGVDLNFGCPAPTVNRHDGGATLLKYPQRIREIVRAVRTAVPAHLPVSAKLRLGWDSLDPIHENSLMAAEGGASWITIHARTRMQGYQPPVYWQPIGEVRRRLPIPIVANGDIWTLEDFKKCREQTRCEHFMIGRGALSDPHLQFQIAHELGLSNVLYPTFSGDPVDWVPILRRFSELGWEFAGNQGYATRRIKQWMRMNPTTSKQEWFESLKRADNLDGVFAALL